MKEINVAGAVSKPILQHATDTPLHLCIPAHTQNFSSYIFMSIRASLYLKMIA